MRFAPAFVLAAALAAPAFAQTDTSFTYQGRLTSSGTPYTGPLEVIAFLYADATGPTQLANTPSQLVNADSGVFTINLDFNPLVLAGAPRWVELAVRVPPSLTYTNLSPRQPVTRSPYSIQTRGIFVGLDNSVGIGTLSPVARLDLRSSNSSVQYLESIAPGGTWFRIQNTSGVNPTWAIEATGATSPAGGGKFNLGTNSGQFNTSFLTLIPTGRVGINNPNPAVRLHVNRVNDSIEVARFADPNDLSQLRFNATSFTGQIQAWDGSVDVPSALYLNPTGGRVGINIASGATGTLDVAGSVRARGGTPGSSGSNQNGYAFRAPGDNDSGLFSLGDGQVSVFVNSVEQVRFSTTGVNLATGTAINFGDGTSIDTNRIVATRANVSIDIAPLPAGGRLAVAVTMNGVVPGDVIVFSPSTTDFPFPLIPFSVGCNAANQVRLLVQNPGATTVDAPPFTASFVAIRP